jgi:Tfp pilus assembly protein FimV
MDQIPLVNEEIVGGAKFLEEFDKKFPIAAAVWLKRPNVRRWRLYLASAEITDENRREAQQEMVRIGREMPGSFFRPSQLNLMMVNDPIAEKTLDVHQRHSLPLATVYPVDSFGNLEVEAASAAQEGGSITHMR